MKVFVYIFPDSKLRFLTSRKLKNSHLFLCTCHLHKWNIRVNERKFMIYEIYHIIVSDSNKATDILKTFLEKGNLHRFCLEKKWVLLNIVTRRYKF